MPSPRYETEMMGYARIGPGVSERVRAHIGGRRPAFFLDFDGTLVPIVDRPDAATLPPATRRILGALAGTYLVCMLSGRGLDDLQQKVGLPCLYYGADHGRRIAGPPSSGVELEVSGPARRVLVEAADELQRRLSAVAGVVIEQKGLSLSVHYRLVQTGEWARVAEATEAAVRRFPGLSLSAGKLVHEIRPDDGWNKGRALLWLLDRLALSLDQVCPVCMGDDLTDEDMFRAVGDDGVTILVGDAVHSTRARYRLRDVEQAVRLLAGFVSPVRR